MFQTSRVHGLYFGIWVPAHEELQARKQASCSKTPMIFLTTPRPEMCVTTPRPDVRDDPEPRRRNNEGTCGARSQPTKLCQNKQPTTRHLTPDSDTVSVTYNSRRRDCQRLKEVRVWSTSKHKCGMALLGVGVGEGACLLSVSRGTSILRLTSGFGRKCTASSGQGVERCAAPRDSDGDGDGVIW